MGADLRINGIDELRHALRSLPPALVSDAGPIVHTQAEELARQMRIEYAAHRVTGNLEAHLVVELAGSAQYASARVRNTARHAQIFERGTGERRRANGGRTGVMPKNDRFIATAIRRREVMVAALTELVERAGLVVTSTS